MLSVLEFIKDGYLFYEGLDIIISLDLPFQFQYFSYPLH